MTNPMRHQTTLTRRRLLTAGGAAAMLPLVPRAALGQVATPASHGPERVMVEISQGRIEGRRDGDVTVFQGIPYAQPPVDDLRWVAPQPPLPWGRDTLDATEPGPVAVQLPIPFMDYDEAGEDCLYLNVWVPGTPKPGSDKPVILFIHGGANLFGSGSEYLASRMVEDEDVIVVTFNYRIGIFGTFGFPGLEDSGTFGLLDQVAALQWVRDHIAGFGGDPGNVTIMGQSWGGLAVTAHLVSPLSAGLFHRAIIQSGVAFADMPAGTMFNDDAPARSLWTTADERNEVSRSILDELGVRDTGPVVDALRQVPAGLLAAFSPRYVPYQWGNRMLPEHPLELTRQGKTDPVPVISGSNRDEARLIVTLSELTTGLSGGIDEKGYHERLEHAFGDESVDIAAEYPADAFPSPAIAWATVVTDRVWARPTLEQHRAYAGQQPVWAYEFRDREAPTGFLREGGEYGAGAYHSAELGYQFDVREPAALAASQRRLAAMMNRYWGNFARTGDPNGEDLPEWAPYDGGSMVLGVDDEEDGIAPVDFVEDHRLAFWEGRGAITHLDDDPERSLYCVSGYIVGRIWRPSAPWRRACYILCESRAPHGGSAQRFPWRGVFPRGSVVNPARRSCPALILAAYPAHASGRDLRLH